MFPTSSLLTVSFLVLAQISTYEMKDNYIFYKLLKKILRNILRQFYNKPQKLTILNLI